MSTNFPEHASLLQLESSVLADIRSYGECTGELARQPQRLEASIQTKLSQIRALTRDLELLVEELDSDEERETVARLLTAHASQYNHIQQSLKSAALHRHQNANKIAALERQQLLGTPEAAAKRKQMATDADVVGTSEGITESLRRTRQIMSEELQHTSTTLAAMDVSHTQLSRTRDEYLGQHGILKRSKGLLRTITWQQKSETILLWCGLALFVLTAGYVAQKRALYFVPEALRPMAVIKTTYRIIRGGPGSKILANRSDIDRSKKDGGGGQQGPAARRRTESSQRPPPSPASRVDSTSQKSPEAIKKLAKVVEIAEKEAVEVPEIPPPVVEEKRDKEGTETSDAVEHASEVESATVNDSLASDVHVEL
ncbi:hypothetical protein Ndes2526B_g05721 [Nannochloris sp. 'desiccata']